MTASDDLRALWAPGTDGKPASEDDCLELVDKLFPSRTAHNPLGRGSDCAELESLPTRLALSTDMFLEDVHFRRSYCTPGEVGAKALSRAVSDLAAAGAAPLGFSLSLMIPDDIGMNALNGLLSGMATQAQQLGMALTGGDIARSSLLGCSLTVWGETVRQDVLFLRRGPSRPGDAVFLVGRCGLALSGFLVLERDGRGATERFPEACAAHLSPRARVHEGDILAALAAESGARLCLMDVSDGLVRDLPRLLAPCGADIILPPQSMHAELIDVAHQFGVSPEQLVLQGGEDYALIGTCTQRFFAKIQEMIPEAILLGTATPEQGIRSSGIPVQFEGFDHFTRYEGDAPPAPIRDSGKPIVELPPLRDDEEEAGTPDVFADAPDAFVDTPELFADAPEVFVETAPEAPFAHEDREIVLPESITAAPLETEHESEIRHAIHAIISGCREAWKTGVMAGFNGNCSIRVGDGPLSTFLITRSGAAKSRLQETDFSRVSMTNVIRLQGAEPSTESGLHAAVYRKNPQTRVILHTHPPCLLALSLCLDPDKRLDLPLPEAERYRELLGHIPYFPPGSDELAAATGEASRQYPALWLERHGLVVHGPDLAFALSLSEELEQLAKVHLDVLRARKEHQKEEEENFVLDSEPEDAPQPQETE